MVFVGIDPDGVRNLATAMRSASDEADGLSGEVTAALALAELSSNVPTLLQAEAIELDKVAAILDTRADLVEGFDVDVDRLAETLGITTAQAQAALDALRDPEFEGENQADPLLTLVAQDHFLFDDLPQSLRDVFIGLPPEGEDPALDAALERLNRDLLPSVLSGVPFDATDLSDQQQADVRLLASALGGDDITITRTRREKYSGAQGDDEYRTVTEDVAITDLGLNEIIQFVTARLAGDAQRRSASRQLARATAGIDRTNMASVAADMGIPERDLSVVLGVSDVLQASDDLGVTALATDDSFPDRNDFPEGEQGDVSYINAVELDRLDALDAGRNVVGPVGSEDNPFFEALGSLFGAQNLAFSHDIQATQAEIQNRNNPGFLGIDFPNAVTATFGYAAAVVTSRSIANFNSLLGTNIDVGAIGTALADDIWSAFGYDVNGPTIAQAQAKQKLLEEEKRRTDDGGGGPRHTTGSGDDSYDSRDDGDNASGATSEGASGQGRGPSGQI